MRCTAEDVLDRDHGAAHRAGADRHASRGLPDAGRAGRRCRRRPRPTTSRSGPRTRTRCRASCGTPRCGSARRSPRTSSPSGSAPSGCSSSRSSRRSRTPGRPTWRSHVDFDGWQYLSKANGGDPMKADKKRPLVYFGSFQDLLGREGRQHQGQERVAALGQLGPGDLRRVPLRRLARQRQGAVRGRGRRGRQEGSRGRVRHRARRVRRGARGAVRATRPTSCRSRRARTSTSRARRSRRSRPASSSRSRSSTGPTPTSSAPSSSSPTSTRTSGTRTRRCPRCGCSPTRCPTS